VEKALWCVLPAKDCLIELGEVALRCCAFAPEARPRDLRELQVALDRVVALGNSVACARQLEDQQRPGEALQFLEWALAAGVVGPDDENSARNMAANLAQRLQMPARELQHLQGLGGDRARRRRMEIQYEEYLKKPPIRTGDSDSEGDQILKELARFRPEHFLDLEREERITAKEDLLRAAMIYLRRGDLHQRAQELFAVTQLDFQDIDALFLYGLSLNDIDAPAETMNQLIEEAARRLRRLKEAEILEKEEVSTWNERFQSLR
jgi:hypothetical protein